jgi:2-C-methyl-D-erythritol 2,4-cyclodiphosphate synthase
VDNFANRLRIGHGVDVHAFTYDRKLIIGGVDIPYSRGLAGHSDADVLSHAVADALLGALRAGDIGKLFPEDDPRYSGANSLLLLAEVGRLVLSFGYRIIDIDTVVMAQEPKLAPYRDAMRKNIAQALGIEEESVGVKATTTEHLGFIGREEGILAEATCLLCRCQ